MDVNVQKRKGRCEYQKFNIQSLLYNVIFLKLK